MIEGDPYVCNSTPTEMDIVFWGNGATATGTVTTTVEDVRKLSSTTFAAFTTAWATECYARGNTAETSHVYGAKLTR